MVICGAAFSVLNPALLFLFSYPDLFFFFFIFLRGNLRRRIRAHPQCFCGTSWREHCITVPARV